MIIVAIDLKLTSDERTVLTGMLRSTTISAELARRGRVVPALANSDAYATIAAR